MSGQETRKAPSDELREWPWDRSQSVGALLRDAREAQGRSMREVAAVSEFNSGYLSLVERDKVAEPRLSQLARLAWAYGIEFTRLLEAALERPEVKKARAWRPREERAHA